MPKKLNKVAKNLYKWEMRNPARFFLLSIFLTVEIFSVQVFAAERSPRFLVHLLDYLAKDYAGAVSQGKVISDSEYREQVEFSESAMESTRELHELDSMPEIRTQAEALHRLIQNKGDAEKVAELARAIQAKVIQAAQLEVAPSRWPDLKRGKQLYSQNCVSCHGVRGAGDGVAAAGLNPRPANFLDEHMRKISPFQAFNTVRLGVPGTAMLPYHGLSDKEVWDLSFYILSLRYSDGDGDIKANPELLKQISTQSDEKLETQFSKDRLAALRLHSGEEGTGANSLQIARQVLNESLSDYRAGLTDGAKTKALKAYLEGIEPIEPRLRASDPAAVSELETRMSNVRSAIESHLAVTEVQAKVQIAQEKISEVEKLLSSREMSPWVAFIAAAAILLREGFEAVLVVIALLGVIRAAGTRKAALWVHGGWLSALGLGGVLWFFSGWLMGMSGAQRETLEGVTSIFAVVVLLVVGFWLHSQTEVGRWKAFIHGKVQRALDGRNLWTLASISFVAVFREAFETVLFLRAIWLEAGSFAKLAMAAGVLSAFALVIGMAWVVLKRSAKLPIRNLFAACAGIMAVLALILTGKGLHSFQETGVLGVNNSPFSFHSDWLGIYPTWETLLSQVAVFALVAGLWVYGKKPR